MEIFTSTETIGKVSRYHNKGEGGGKNKNSFKNL